MTRSQIRGEGMEFRTLGRSPLKVSRIALGTMTFGAQTNEATAFRMVNQSLEAGVNFFDTANVYNQGQSEEILGKTLRGRREKVILATKVGMKTGEATDGSGLSGAAIRKAIDASLKRLRTDYVDIYYLHQPDYNIPVEETLAEMDKLVRSGKIRYPAVSNFAAWQVAEIHCLAQKKAQPAPYVSQPMYNLIARGIEDEYLPFCRHYGVSVVAYNPLAGGLLTGKHHQGGQPLLGTRFDKNQMYLDRYWHPDDFAAVEDLRNIAQESGMSLIELAFQWLLNREAVDCILLGASRLEQLLDNLEACQSQRLDPMIADKCDAVWKKLRGISPKYNR